MAHNNTFPLAGILEKDKLHESRTNFVEWYRNVRIVLKGCKKDYVLEATLGDSPPKNAIEEAMNSSTNAVMITSLFSVPCLLRWNQNFKRGLRTGVHLKQSMS